jgi:hypothetical protein
MPMQKSLYPKDWNSTAVNLKAAAGWRCQRCKKRHGDPTYNRFGRPCRVVLTVAHLDHDPRNPNARLAVLCARCHLQYDRSRPERGRKARKMAMARGQLTLFDEMKEEGSMSP